MPVDGVRKGRAERQWTIPKGPALPFAVVLALAARAGAQVCYVESAQPWTAAAADAWEVMDLSGAPYNVPAGAVVEIAVRNADAGNELYGGVRAVGSSLDRRFQLHEAENGGTDVVVMHVQTDASSSIEQYADDTTLVDFMLLGYWTCGVYTEAFQPFKAGGAGSWLDHDLGTYGVTGSRVAEIVVTNSATGSSRTVGVRTDGSALSRTIILHEAEAGGVEAATFFVETGATANATIEVYTSNNGTVDFHLMGYWPFPPGPYTELAGTVGSPTSDATWQDSDLTGLGVPADAVAEILLGNLQATEPNEVGVRSNGSSLARLLDLQEAEPTDGDFARMHVTADAASLIEVYHEDVSDPHQFLLIGYWEPQGSLALMGHAAGQEADAFLELGVATDAELFSFKLAPFGGDADVTELVITISSIAGLTDLDWAGVELVVDDDDDGEVDPGETTTVGGTPAVDQGAGTITFSTQFTVTTGTNYILRADFASLVGGDMVRLSLAYGDITTTSVASGAVAHSLHHEGCFYFEHADVWSATTVASWEVKDLSGAPFFVPADAVVEIAVRNSNGGAERYGGVRAWGSGLERRFQLHEPEAGGTDIIVMHVQADALSRIEHYAETTADVSFLLLGYWDCGTYVEAFDQFSATAPAAWEDYDLDAHGVGKDQVAEIALINTDAGNEFYAGVRRNGIHYDRRIQLHEAEGDGGDAATLLVETDATTDARIEIYAGDVWAVAFYLIGYWSTPPAPFGELFVDLGSPSASGAWESIDLSGFDVPPGTVACVTLVNQDAGTECEMGVRMGGSDLDRWLDIHEAEAGGEDVGRMHAAAASGSFIEFRHEIVTSPHRFYLTAIWGTEVATPKLFTWSEVEP